MKDEDKTFENERKHMNEPVEDRGPLDLTLLTDQYRKDLNHALELVLMLLFCPFIYL